MITKFELQVLEKLRLIDVKMSYSISRFSFRENKTEKTFNSNLAKEKANEKKTEKVYFRAMHLQ